MARHRVATNKGTSSRTTSLGSEDAGAALLVRYTRYGARTTLYTGMESTIWARTMQYGGTNRQYGGRASTQVRAAYTCRSHTARFEQAS